MYLGKCSIMENGRGKIQAVEICWLFLVTCIQLKEAYLKADIPSSCGLQSDSLPQEIEDIAGDKIEGEKINFVIPFSDL